MRRIQSVKENITFKDVILTGAPTAGTYTGYLNGYMNELLPPWLLENPWLALSITVVIFLIILFIIYMVNYEASRRSLAEVLATGYFMNFSGKLTTLLKRSSDITFIRSSGPLTIHPDNVMLEILLPTSRNKLDEAGVNVQANAEIAYIDPYPFDEPNWWLKIQVENNGNSVRILEFPRTLYAIPKYLSSEYSELTSIKIHKAFNNKLHQLLAENPEERPPDNRFEIRII